MIDFSDIRRRAEYHQEEAPLGSAVYTLSQDVLSLLDEMHMRDQQDYRMRFDAVSRANDALECERDEARKLHAAVCDKYADALVRLNRVHSALADWTRAHRMEPEVVSGMFFGPVPSAVSK